jgi:hypothetical protein
MKQWLYQGEEEALSAVDDHHNPDIDIVFFIAWSSSHWPERWEH